jgi:WD40 repeat protein
VQVAFSPDDQQIMTQVTLGTSAEGDTDGQLQLQDAVTGEVLQSLDYATDGNAALRQFAFSPDGKFLASASHLSANSSRARDEDRISLWRLNQNKRFDYFQTIQLVEADFAFVDMVFTDSGLLNFLRQQIQGTRLDTWNVNTGGAYGYIELPDADRTDTFTRLSPDGKYYFIRGDVAGSRLGNVQTGEVKILEGYIDRAAVFGTQGDYLAISNDQNIRIFSK